MCAAGGLRDAAVISLPLVWIGGENCPASRVKSVFRTELGELKMISVARLEANRRNAKKKPQGLAVARANGVHP